jgi:Protein of unknown function (DUF1656)
MIRDLDVYGVFLPPLLVWTVVALAVTAALRRLLAWCGGYRFVWHRPLFDLALLVIVLGAVVAGVNRWLPP